MALTEREAPYLVGGTYAFRHYTGIARPTKDLDLFVQKHEIDRVLEMLRDAGWLTHATYPHWLAKARRGQHTIDVIHGSGNGLANVDAGWFGSSRPSQTLGVPTRLVPPEEMIWSKSFLMEKYRFDGADVAHLLLRQGPSLDWERLVRRFGRHFQVLLSHLLLFDFIYPGQQVVPRSLILELARRTQERRGVEPGEPLCQGTLLSRKQYRHDVETWGFRDARLDPDVSMTPGDIASWTLATPPDPGPDM
jgi:hypothetical protein